MPEPNFDMLRDHLLKSGVASRHVVRMISELSDHCEDLATEAMRQGLSREAAKVDAMDRIGDASTIAQHVLDRPELRCWNHRYPRLARILMPLACVLISPTAPIHAGVAYAPVIGRWCACLMASGVITATMLLAMQLAIAIS